MRRSLSWFQLLRSLGDAGRATDNWARARWHTHRRRALTRLGIFDGVPLGRIRGAGALGRLGQLRIGWWHDLVAAAQDAGSTTVVVQVDQIRWLLQKIESKPSDRPTDS